MGIESVQALTLAAANTPLPAESAAPTQLKAAATPAGSLLAQRQKVGIDGLTSTFTKASISDSRFRGEVRQLLKDNKIPLHDLTAVKIVQSLHFLESIRPVGLGPQTRDTMDKVSAYAHDKLQNFTSAYRSNAMSGGTNPPDFVVNNARNDALFMVKKYFGTTDFVVPNVQPRERDPLKGEVGV